VARLHRGDPRAWSELVRDYTGLVWGIARRTFSAHGFVAGDPDVEDVVAEVWRNLLVQDRRLLEQCRNRGGLTPLLVTLARNRAIDRMRRSRKEPIPVGDALPDVRAPEPDVTDSAPPPEALTGHLLAALPPRERTCIRLFYLQGKKYRDIEALTGIPMNSIGPTLKRALARLREAMTERSLGTPVKPDAGPPVG